MVEAIIIVILLILSAFFSSSETALTAISRARLFALTKQGDNRAKIATRLREKKDLLISTILLGNNMVNIAAASLATALSISVWGNELGPIYATFFTTIVVLLFGEVLPKTLAINHTESVALRVAWPLQILVKLLWPLTYLVQALVSFVFRLFKIHEVSSSSLISPMDAIRGTIEMHHQEGGVQKSHRDMLASILDLWDREIGEVMIHRTQVYAINIADEPERIVELAVRSVHSRIPIYKHNPDNIIGIMHTKDVLRLVSDKKAGLTREMIRRITARPWFVPDTTTLGEQLYAFQSRRKHFACVVDEYGAFQGIVTLEDIIEEIVGEIDDEHDVLEIDEIMPYGDSAYRVDGTVTIRDLNRHLDWQLPDEHAATIAGLILHEAEMIPEQGAVFQFHGVRFTIAERLGNQISQVIVERLSAPL